MLDYIHNTTLYSDPYQKGSYEWWANLNKSIDYNKKKNTDTSDPEKKNRN